MTLHLPQTAPAAPVHLPARLWALDAARGVAIIGMVVFHLAWDLHLFGFSQTDVTTHPGWRAFSHLIAGSFLFIAGVSLALAHGSRIRPATFWRRFRVIFACAMLVTAATLVMFPGRFVVFGILHAIAFTTLAAMPLMRLPWWGALAAAAAVLMAHQAVLADSSAWLQAWFSGSMLFPVWQTLGLTETPPVAVDFVPFFPWAAVTFTGCAVGLLLRRTLIARAARQEPRATVGALAATGRLSLLIYLIHQPILIGLLAALAWLAPGLTTPPAARAAAQFSSECMMTCRMAASRETCERGCGCILDALKADPRLLRRALVENRADADTNARFAGIVAACRR
jgi:uncharacterized membrane protein